MIGLALGAHHVSATLRTALGHVKLARAARLVLQHLDDLGNDVATALHRDPVADAHAQPLDLVHVVQGGAAHRGSANRYRLQRGHRRQLSGASHLHQDVFDLRFARARRKLVGNRPARRLAGEAQLILQADAIDFHHDAVDLVRQLVAHRRPSR